MLKQIIILSLCLAGIFTSYAQKQNPLDMTKEHKDTPYWLPEEIRTYYNNNLLEYHKFTYNHISGQLLSHLIQIPNGNVLEKSSEFVYSYTEATAGTEIAVEERIHVPHMGEQLPLGYYPYEKQIYTYNKEGKLISHLELRANNLAWTNEKSIIYTYDNDNNLKTVTTQFWQNNQWQNSYQYTYSYTDNKVSTIQIRNWTNGLWKNSYQETYTYNQEHNISTILRQKQNNAVWENDIFYHYYYNEDTISYTLQYWRNGQWENSSQNITVYDANDNILSEFDQSWESYSDGRIAKTDYLYTYSYDENNNRITGNYTSQDWINDSLIDYNHPSKGFICKFGYLLKDIFLKDCDEYEVSYIKSTEIPVSIYDILNNSQINVYPNPATSQIHIIADNTEIKEIVLYAINGQFLKKTVKTTIQIEELPSGMYFLQIKTDKGVLTKRFVKQ
jgi:hypothetical protein